jgi:hypothetical protein
MRSILIGRYDIRESDGYSFQEKKIEKSKKKILRGKGEGVSLIQIVT